MQQDQNTQQSSDPIMSNNDELAKTLDDGLQFEETPVGDNGNSHTPSQSSSGDNTDMPGFGAPSNDAPGTDPLTGETTPPSLSDLPEPSNDQPSQDAPFTSSDTPNNTSAPKSDLDQLKSSALDDLRPLVGKLSLNPKEKFDTLLLIIRSTDDQSLLAEAHQAAKEITDDTERAQALLDIIKEVDYFNGKK